MEGKQNKKRAPEASVDSKRKKGEKEEMDDVEQVDDELDCEDDVEEQQEDEEVVMEEEEDDVDPEERSKKDMEMIEKENAQNAEKLAVFRPGKDKLEEDEVLDYDPTAYVLYHKLDPEWSCLSFDVFPDKLGASRTKFPMTAYWVAGTQAENAPNKLLVFKASELMGSQYDSDEEEDDTDPILEFKQLRHNGCINRVRVMPQEPHIVSTWSDTGSVYLWNVSEHVKALDVPPATKLSDAPIHQLTAHKTEGFAMSWSLTKPGRLLTGDLNKQVFLTELQSGTTWVQDSTPYSGHKGSVEDIEWSPTELEVFATCSSDKTVKIWDTRMKKNAARSFLAADCDVNAIAWNRKVTYLLASGSDDGSLRIWDLRTLKDGNACSSIAHFKWHNDQVTSLEWDPYDESTIAVSGADGQVSVWDMSVEKDTEATDNTDVDDIPPQLMFVHQGQTDTKEVHYHPQLPGVLMSTAENGIDIFKPDIETGPEDE